MALATTGANGAEKLAIRWAQQKGVKTVIAKPDFAKHNKAAPFKANDALLELNPVLCLTLPHSLDASRRETTKEAGVVLNIRQKALETGVRHLAVALRG